jgi:hypothetical protein
MSLGFCVYDLTIGIEDALNAFTRIADHLGLSNERVLVGAQGNTWLKPLPLGRLDKIDSLLSGLEEFSFSITTGDPYTAILSNSERYLSYARGGNGDRITVFSPQHGDLRDFAERFMRDVPGKYGFGMDWRGPGCFCGYAYGFEDSKSTGGDPFGESAAGRWGVLYLQSESNLFDQARLRGIYPVNLLTTTYLNRETRDGTVRDMILRHKDWGGITPLAENWFMWWVPLSEVEKVRREFESNGLLENI